MNINNRIERLEQILGGTVELESVPEEWSRFDPETGKPKGPPADASPAQLRTWRTVESMLTSVPFVRQ